MLPKMGGYVRSIDETKYMPFLIKDDEKFGIKAAIVLKKIWWCASLQKRVSKNQSIM